jgi:hypothetical protein
MTIFHALKGSAQEAAISKSPATTRRVLYALEDKVATFTKLVPWPALAASFQADINYLRSTNEPQDRQSPAQG